MSSVDLAEFLLARIAEDEASARNVMEWKEAPRERRLPWKVTPSEQRVVAWGLTVVGAANTPVLAEHIARWDPARVLAECEAKRRLVEDFRILHRDYRETHSETTEARRFQAVVTMARLAEGYADHPDYRQEWRP